ncbi:phosphoribosylamine--glycine ligase [Lentisphaerota bacterium WC36G]|nr:phosphoribosylamine--glycine ligase [Lentisphaerae bacterium WC36]
MKVLVVGSGGREHVLAWKLSKSSKVSKVFCAPGNAGIANDAECIDIAADNYEALASFAESNNIALTMVGPEAPLCDGIVDVFNEKGLKVFGPDKYAAQLEGSKSFAKNFMLKYNIPTAKSGTFTDPKKAKEYIENEFANGETAIVVKADGLAAGKGVIVAMDKQTALDAIDECFDGAFGDAGYKVVIEECLIGEEASILALCDGKTIISLASSQDHKRVGDGDTGLNTGGMGAYSPAPVVTEEINEFIRTNVLDNFLRGVKEEKLNFHGVLFVGVMITDKGPKVLEFNVRFGDPEVQAVMSRLESDLFEVANAVVDERLDEIKLQYIDGSAVCVVMASGGYPGSYQKGFTISGLKEAEADGAKVFHAGTAFAEDGSIINTGGRVLGVTATGNDIKTAINKAYKAVEKINWDGSFYRKDIAYRALDRLK